MNLADFVLILRSISSKIQVINVAEVWAIRDGLQLAKEMGIRKLEVESDSTYVVQLCNKEIQVTWFLRGLTEDIYKMKQSFEDVVFKQRFREANSVEDLLAKDSAARLMEGVWISQPPKEIIQVLGDDLIGRANTRVVRSVS